MWNGLRCTPLVASLLFLTFAACAAEDVKDTDLFFPNFQDVALEGSSFGFTQFMLRNKMFAVAAIVKVNWFEAQQICSYNGMTLASVTSPSEMEQLRDFLSKNGLTSQNFWLSGTDLGNEQNWFWFSSGRPLSYENWDRNEPNNSGGSEHCLEVRVNGAWNDVKCDKSNYFICENRCQLDSYTVPIYTRK